MNALVGPRQKSFSSTEAISLPGIGKLFACHNFEITDAKGRLISKCLLGVFNSSEKRTKTILLDVP